MKRVLCAVDTATLHAESAVPLHRKLHRLAAPHVRLDKAEDELDVAAWDAAMLAAARGLARVEAVNEVLHGAQSAAAVVGALAPDVRRKIPLATYDLGLLALRLGLRAGWRRALVKLDAGGALDRLALGSIELLDATRLAELPRLPVLPADSRLG